MSFVDSGQEIANAVQRAQVTHQLTNSQVLIIIGDMLHVWLTKLDEESKDGTEDLVHGGHALRARADNGDERPAVQAH